jgi:hypothetical protein
MQTAIPKIRPRREREPLTRSQIMARIRSSDTRPEILTRAAVHALGMRFRNHVMDLPGKPAANFCGGQSETADAPDEETFELLHKYLSALR